MHVAVIPARSGSKGVPDKNIQQLWGHTLLGWAILCAKVTGLFDEVVCSTDSQIYATEALRYGATVPYLRPVSLANDTTPIADTLLELIGREGQDWQTLTLLEPSCPLRTPGMVTACFQAVVNDSADSALTISEVPLHYHPQKQFQLGSDGTISYAHPAGAGIRNRQELQPTWIRNGGAYTLRISTFRCEKTILHGRIAGLPVTDPLINIDDTHDMAALRAIEAQTPVPAWLNEMVAASLR